MHAKCACSAIYTLRLLKEVCGDTPSCCNVCMSIAAIIDDIALDRILTWNCRHLSNNRIVRPSGRELFYEGKHGCWVTHEPRPTITMATEHNTVLSDHCKIVQYAGQKRDKWTKFNNSYLPNLTSASQPIKGAILYERNFEMYKTTTLKANISASDCHERENNACHTSSNSIFLLQQVLVDLFHHCFQ